jgi:hypothetical protein
LLSLGENEPHLGVRGPVVNWAWSEPLMEAGSGAHPVAGTGSSGVFRRSNAPSNGKVPSLRARSRNPREGQLLATHDLCKRVNWSLWKTRDLARITGVIELAPTRKSPPLCELDTLALFVVVARRFAATGDPVQGYTALVAGAGRAADARSAGEPWAEELTRLYRQVMDRYAALYNIARD